MLNVTPNTMLTLRQKSFTGTDGFTLDSQPLSAYLVDVIAAAAGVNSADAQRVLSALAWIDATGQVSRMAEAAPPARVPMEQRLRWSRWAMVDLLRHAPARDGQTEEIRARLTRLYEKHGNADAATALTAR